MVSSAVPVSALNCNTASRRLPLPSPPSANVVGVIVAGTQRRSKNSTDGRKQATLLVRGMDRTPKKGKEQSHQLADDSRTVRTTATRLLTAEAIVIAGRGVVVGDDGQGVGEERPQ